MKRKGHVVCRESILFKVAKSSSQSGEPISRLGKLKRVKII